MMTKAQFERLVARAASVGADTEAVRTALVRTGSAIDPLVGRQSPGFVAAARRDGCSVYKQDGVHFVAAV